MLRPHFAHAIAMAAFHLHLLFSDFVTSLQYILPALSKNAIVLLMRSLDLVACLQSRVQARCSQGWFCALLRGSKLLSY